MFELAPISDRAPVLGMNNVDDPKDLKPGQCVELVNAMPGNPPNIRKGTTTYKISSTDGMVWVPPLINQADPAGTLYIVGWVFDSPNYKLVKLNVSTRVLTVLGTAAGLSNPSFDFVKARNALYALVSSAMTQWNSDTKMLSHKIVELGVSSDVIREMCFDVAPRFDGNSVTLTGDDAVGVFTLPGAGQSWIGYAWTYIRHTAYGAVQVATFNPADNESFEDPTYQHQVQIVTDSVHTKYYVKINMRDISTDRAKAVAQGATHVRIYRSRIQSSQEDAAGATKFFCKDLPIGSVTTGANITSIALPSNDVVVTASSHGFVSSVAPDTLIGGVVGTTEVNGRIFDITVSDTNTFTLDDTDTESFSDYTSGGYATKDYVAVASVDLTNSLVRITTSAPHGLSTGNQALVTGLGGMGGEAAQSYGMALYENANLIGPHWWISWNKPEKSSLNENVFTVTVIDSTTLELQGATSQNYKKLYEMVNTSYGTVPLVYYAGRPAASFNPYTSGGYIGKNLKSISNVTAPKNVAIVETPTAHGLPNGTQIYLRDFTAPIELKNKSFYITVVDTTHFKLDGANTSGLAAYSGTGHYDWSSAGFEFSDTVSDAALSEEVAQLKAFNYAVAPQAKFAEFAKDRMWLFGVLNNRGRAYYCEYPGGDDGTPLDLALAFPKKYLSWWKGEYSVSCGTDSGQEETGLKAIYDDVYFFYDNSIFALFGGDPAYSAPKCISDNLGLAFPRTLCKATIVSEELSGLCLLFLSNKGPAYIKQTGEVGLLTSFSIAELWPNKSSELWDDLTNYKAEIWNNCTAAFWNDCWTIMYKTHAGVHKVFNYYFNPATKDNRDAAKGPWVYEGAQV